MTIEEIIKRSKEEKEEPKFIIRRVKEKKLYVPPRIHRTTLSRKAKVRIRRRVERENRALLRGENVYTSLKTFNSTKCKCARPYTELPSEKVQFANDCIANHLAHPTRAEYYLEAGLKERKIPFYREVYFNINGHQFFLDFYLPQNHKAIELDGGYHVNRVFKDRERDRLFKQIGITTIRFDNFSMYGEHPEQVVLDRLQSIRDEKEESRKRNKKLAKEREKAKRKAKLEARRLKREQKRMQDSLSAEFMQITQ